MAEVPCGDAEIRLPRCSRRAAARWPGLKASCFASLRRSGMLARSAVRPQKRIGLAEHLGDVHPFAHRTEGHSTRRQRRAELQVGLHLSAMAVAHLERVPPKARV